MRYITSLYPGFAIPTLLSFIGVSLLLFVFSTLSSLAHPVIGETGNPLGPAKLTYTSKQLHTSSSTKARFSIDSDGPSITVFKTVGVEPTCATTNDIVVTSGTEVVYCYFVHNTGSITIERHTVEDDKLGVLISDTLFPLGPTATVRTSALFTVTHPMTQTTTNRVAWFATAMNGQVVSATDSATVTVPTLTLTKTVGTEAATCGSHNEIVVAAGTAVYHCYVLVNQSPISFLHHTLRDSKLGPIFEYLSYTLAPKQQLNTVEEKFIVSATVSAPTVNRGTWTASISGTALSNAVTDIISATASELSTVHVPSILVTKTVGLDPSVCPSTNEITVTFGTEVVHCYFAHNPGSIPLVLHTVLDSHEGQLLDKRVFSLAPSPQNVSSIFFTVTKTITQTLHSSMTWAAELSSTIPGANDSGLIVTDHSSSTIYVQPGATFTAFVFEDVNGNGIKEENESQIEGAVVRLESNSESHIDSTSNSEGLYSFEHLLPSIYTATIDLGMQADNFKLTTANIPFKLVLKGNDEIHANFGYVRIARSHEMFLPLVAK